MSKSLIFILAHASIVLFAVKTDSANWPMKTYLLPTNFLDEKDKAKHKFIICAKASNNPT